MVSKLALAAATTACALAVGTLNASAAIAHLTSVAMRTADAPAGLSTPHMRLYHHLPAHMRVGITVAGTATTASCALPTAFHGEGWRSGMIQAFDRSRPSIALQVCASLFSGSTAAHRAFGQLVVANLTPLVSLKQATPLPTVRVGDESSATDRAMTECTCTSIKTHTYEVVFRHQNAVVDVTYTGPSTFTVTQFVRLVSRANNRLR